MCCWQGCCPVCTGSRGCRSRSMRPIGASFCASTAVYEGRNNNFINLRTLWMVLMTKIPLNTHTLLVSNKDHITSALVSTQIITWGIQRFSHLQIPTKCQYLTDRCYIFDTHRWVPWNHYWWWSLIPCIQLYNRPTLVDTFKMNIFVSSILCLTFGSMSEWMRV